MRVSKGIRNTLLIFSTSLVIIVISGLIVFYPVFRMFNQSEVIQYDPELAILIGGGNSIVLNSSDGETSLIVDTKMGPASKKILSRVTGKKVVLINTHLHPDHTGGNKYFPDAEVIAGRFSPDEWEQEMGSLPYPDHTINPGSEKVIPIGRERVIIRNMGQAHSQQDCVVFLKNRRFLITGDLLFEGIHPVLFNTISSSIKWRAALETLMDEFPVETVLPGHGPLATPESIRSMIRYFQDVEKVLAGTEIQKTMVLKYSHLRKIPFVSGFGRTLRFMRFEAAQREAGRF